MFCSEWALVKRTQPGLTVTPLRCKCWTCDQCRPARTARLIAEAKAGQPNTMITLTSRRVEGWSPHVAAQRLSHAWRQVRREYVKEHGKGSLAFLVVFEATKLGWPHLHIVARCKWIDQKWLSRRMGALIGSPYVWVNRIDGIERVAAYIAKYIGKNPHRFIGTKRYWRSQDYLLTEEEPATEEEPPYELWWIEKCSWRTAVRRFAENGYTVQFDGEKAILTHGIPP